MAVKEAFAGVDVSSQLLHLAIRGNADVAEFENTAAGHKQLIGYLKKRARHTTVVLESTGTYGLDLALAMHVEKRIKVCYVNPARARAFAKARHGRAKTDRVDARDQAQMAASLELEEWEPPEPRALALRALTRRLRAIIDDRTREKNRLAAVQATVQYPAALREDIEAHIAELDARAERIKQAALAHALSFEDYAAAVELLVSIKGVGDQTAVEVLGELQCMPRDLTVRQVVAQAGLDPRARQSGTKDGPRKISKMGSRYLRATLYVAAMNTVKWCPQIRRFHDVLVDERHKKKKVAYVAVARKLLHTIHGMLASHTRFDPTRFYNERTLRQVA